MSVVILQDEIVHYEVLGRGRPLIFLHGWIGSWRYWIPTMQSVSISYRTYAIDLWGFGDTAKISKNYTLEQQVSLVSLFLQEMGISKVALIGHGLGAIVSILYAFQYKNLVDRVMAVSMPNGQYSINPRLYSSPPVELAEWLLTRSPETEAARMDAPKADHKAIQYSLSNLQRVDIHQCALNMKTPCLLVFGQNDPVIEASQSRDLTPTLPEHIHQIIFDDSGHFPMLDEPNKFNRLLIDFLALDSGTSPRQLQIKAEWRRRVR